MKTSASVIAIVVAAAAIGFGIYMVDINQTEEARLPDVDVSVEGGNLPEFDAEVGTISVGSTEETVTVPDIEITTQEATVTLPTIDVDAPEEDGQVLQN